MVPAVFEDFIAWLWQERRVKHIFLDLKFTPGQEDAALSLLAHLYRLSTCGSFRPDLVFHLLSPHLEIIEALLAKAWRLSLPATLRLYADFDLPGGYDFARQAARCAPYLYGLRYALMGRFPPRNRRGHGGARRWLLLIPWSPGR
jgi:hypothetical protein